MSLNSHQRQFLKAQAHSLKPVVLLGNDGLSESVLKELDSSIEHHELIKVELQCYSDRETTTADSFFLASFKLNF